MDGGLLKTDGGDVVVDMANIYRQKSEAVVGMTRSWEMSGRIDRHGADTLWLWALHIS